MLARLSPEATVTLAPPWALQPAGPEPAATRGAAGTMAGAAAVAAGGGRGCECTAAVRTGAGDGAGVALVVLGSADALDLNGFAKGSPDMRRVSELQAAASPPSTPTSASRDIERNRWTATGPTIAKTPKYATALAVIKSAFRLSIRCPQGRLAQLSRKRLSTMAHRKAAAP